MNGWILGTAADRQSFAEVFGNLEIKWVRAISGDVPPDVDFILVLGGSDPASTDVIAALRATKAPLVLLDAVAPTLRSFDVDERFVRINGWNTFLQRPLAEVAILDGATKTQSGRAASAMLNRFFEAWDKPFVTVPDVPGMPSARIISMIINEAYFALGEGVSDRESIDRAMKFGTNYPFGPFEWAGKIGRKRITGLLDALYVDDPLYEVAPLLREEAG